MQSQDIHYLLGRYTRGELNEDEQRELAKLLQDPERGPFIQEELVRLLEQQEDSEGDERMSTRLDSDAWEPVLQRVLSVDKTAGAAVEGGGGSLRARYYVLRRLSVAASILLVIGGGAFFFFHARARRPAAPAVAAVASVRRQQITPGTNKAVLTLANGQKIMLNDAQKGTLGLQGNTKVIKLDTGALQYTTQTAASADRGVPGPMYNTIATPRGGQYQVVLADGTKVWLNAESSLRFPTAFAGKDRVVELTGEAYFEVAANKDKPFIVRAAETETRVLGTHFNIMAYADEGAVKTTLLEGAVSMGQGGQRALLQPGEQGQFEPDKDIIARRVVNTSAVVAWKDGYYYFDRTPVQSVMRQIARWYDVQVVYKGSAPKDEIVGRIPRSADVSEVLHIMELIGIRFKIDGKTIIVND